MRVAHPEDAHEELLRVLTAAPAHLGSRITTALTSHGIEVRALVRHTATTDDMERVLALGASPVRADVTDTEAVAAAAAGATCVVSALNGLSDVILDRQSVLLGAAVQAGVPRFIPSDYSADYTRTAPGRNRNFDLRREFRHRVDRAPIRATSILNGAFMDMLGAEMPIIQPRIRRVVYWGGADQPLNFTTKDDVAAYTAAAALDDNTPRVLRIAGATVTARDIAVAATHASGRTYRTLWAGSPTTLAALTRLARRLAPEPAAVFPAWQGMQYMRDMFSGDVELQPLDNNRYPGLRWTTLTEQLHTKLHPST